MMDLRNRTLADIFDEALGYFEGLRRLEAHHPDFLAEVRAWARRISAHRGWVSSDDLRVEAEARGLKPVHPNVWGAVFREAGWKEVGRRASAFITNHAREIRMWRWTGS